jgi:hypothetical protein
MCVRFRRHAVDAVFLHLAGCQFREAKFAEERAQMDAEASLVPFGPARAALSLCALLSLILLVKLVAGARNHLDLQLARLLSVYVS